jgi:hypothetical protein
MKRIVMLATFALIIGMGRDCITSAPSHQQLACDKGNWPNNCRALPEPTDTSLRHEHA